MTCAFCGLAVCAHPDPVYAGIIPLHGPSGSHRAAGIETAGAADTGPYPMPTPAILPEPTAGAAQMACHQKEQSPCRGPGGVSYGENGRQSGTFSPYFTEIELFSVERNPDTGGLRASLWI